MSVARDWNAAGEMSWRQRGSHGPRGHTVPALILAGALLSWTAAANAQVPALISTIGGSGAFCEDPAGAPPTCGDGGPFIAAQFDSPRGLTLTPDGALLIADRFDQRIRLVRPVSAQATISTIAGSGTECAPQTDACGDGGPASDAHLNIPRATALTPGGGYVIADEGDHRIRAVPSFSPDSTITTVAGTGVPCPQTTDACGDGGPAVDAQLNFPHEVVVAANGDLLIADTYDHRVRRVANGTITTVAGTGVQGYGGDGGPATQAELDFPHGLAVTPGGGFLIADSQNHRVRQVSAAGIITTIAGIGRGCAEPTATQNACGDDGPALLAELDLPRSIALTPSGGFIFSDVGTNRVREVSLDGGITTIAGNGVLCTPSEYPCGDGGPALLAALDMPQDVVLAAPGLLIADASEGDAFTGHNVIRVVSPTPPVPPQVTKLAGRAARVGKKGSRGDVVLRGTFTVGAAIDLRATTVRLGGLLDEIHGAGELVSGLPLTLSPRGGTSRTVTFETKPSQRPHVRLRLKPGSTGSTVELRLRVKRAAIPRGPMRCTGPPRRRTTTLTTFVSLTGTAPGSASEVVVATRAWRCLPVHGRVAAALRLP